MTKKQKKLINLKRKILRLVNPKKNLYYAGVLDGIDISLGLKEITTEFKVTAVKPQH